MKRLQHPTGLLVLAVLLVAMVLVTRLRLPAAQIDTVQLRLGPPPALSETGRQLDQVLREHLGAFRRQPHLAALLNIPVRTVDLAPFWVDKCEVRQGALDSFLAWWEQLPPGDPRRLAPAGARYYSSSKGHRVAGRSQAPASGISYFEAQAYCRAAGGQLPSAAQWQAVASGPAGRLYPWGDRFEPAAWPYVKAELNAAQRCGLHPASDTPQGVHDLANGVEEWTRGWDESKAPLLQGVHADKGRRALAVHALNATTRQAHPNYRSHYTGFRCIYDGRRPQLLPWGRGVHPDTVRVPGARYRFGLPADARLPQLIPVVPAVLLRTDSPLLDAEPSARSELRVARCEVSRRHYRLFLADPLVRLGLFANEHEPRHQDYRPQDWARQLAAPALPVSGLDWWSADAFARWVGGRLPSAHEWQLASAGGASGYPWGAVYEPERAVTGDAREARRVSCEALDRGASVTGLRGMGGNVSEWTRSVSVTGRDYNILVKGGNYLLPGALSAHSDFVRAVPLDHRAPDIGLRVVFD